MIITEPYGTRYDGVALTRTYSDSGYRIQLNGTDRIYDEVVDPTFLGRTYTETTIPIQSDEPSPQTLEEAIQIIQTLLGNSNKEGDG